MNIEYKQEIEIQASTREEYRKELILHFLNEEHGTKEKFTVYYYYVETLRDGTKIYLKRPTALNKGFDFEVRATDIQFHYGKHGNIISTGNRPSHKDLFEDLKLKLLESLQKSQELLLLITKIYKCQSVSYEEIDKNRFQQGISVELLLIILKWLFIEQDITYWNRSGRDMLYEGIIEIFDEFKQCNIL